MLALLAVLATSQLQPTPTLSLTEFIRACPRARISFSFEHAPEGTILSAQTLHGVIFHAPGAPLRIVKAADTFSTHEFYEDIHFFRKGEPGEDDPPGRVTKALDVWLNRLPATSGQCILSPGGSRLSPGPDPEIENDDLTLTFDPPIQAFGFDLLSQSRDGQSNTSIRILDAAGEVLFHGDIPIGSSEARAGGADFWGLVLPSRSIARIEIDDRDSNDRYADCNIGFDSLRIFPQPCPLDFDGDAEVTIEDLNKFMSLYATKDAAADFNGDEQVTPADFEAVTASFSRDVKRRNR